MTFLAVLLAVALVIVWRKKSKLKKEKVEVENKLETTLKEKTELEAKLEKTTKEFEDYKEHMSYLKKYEPIKDIEAELDKLTEQMELVKKEAYNLADEIKNEAEQVLEDANNEVKAVKKEARSAAKEIKDKAELVLEDAHNIASRIEADAKQKAKEIAGEAWGAKQNADQYAETAKAMKNIIKGYGNEYLIPHHSLLDELAEEYSHKEAGQELTKIRTLIKSMIKNGEVADCNYVEPHRRATAIEFILDAFNGKVDTIMSKVRHDNYGKLLQALKDAYRLVNHNGKPFRNARITERYFETVKEQLRLAVIIKELKKKDLEEQKQIREAMKEEERVRREVEKALKESEKEERMLEKAMKKAEQKLLKTTEEEKAKFEEELRQIQQKLAEAEAKGKRALSMAQQTKQGHVYIISNVGSFGENVFKIGLTRRLKPLDRVKELGDASVPFAFDVHAMIHSEDAPKLEKELHNIFELNRVNKINRRKEFFEIPISEIKSKIDDMKIETHWTMQAEAQEYRESAELKENTEVV